MEFPLSPRAGESGESGEGTVPLFDLFECVLSDLGGAKRRSHEATRSAAAAWVSTLPRCVGFGDTPRGFGK